MTTDKLILIRREIERLKDELPEPDIKTIVGANALRQVTLLNRLLSFIDSLEGPSHVGEGETVSASYDPEYLQSCIDKAKKSWEGVDVDEFMDEIRGRETVTNCHGLEEEIDAVSKRYPEVSFAKLSRIAKHFAEWGAEHFRDSTKMMDDDLEKEIDRFEDWMDSYNQSDYPTCISTRQIAHHFAEWQKKQDEQKCQGCFDRDEVFWKGMKHAMEEMRKEAISVDIDDFGVKMYEYCIEKLGLTSEDKVKVLILKDEENSKSNF